MLTLAPISGALESWEVLGGARCGLSLRGRSFVSRTFSLGRAVGHVHPTPRTYPFLRVHESIRDSERLQRRKCQASAHATLNMEVEKPSHEARASAVPIMINGATGKMGVAVAEAAISAGLTLVPLALAGPGAATQTIQIGGCEIQIQGAENRDAVLAEALSLYPNLVLVDYTLPVSVNANAEWYCAQGVPFVMGTSGGDRAALLESVTRAGNYAVIAPQMAKQVVNFIAGIEAMADAGPGAFAGYKLTVVESHQSSKVDTSGTAKEVVAAFQRMGLDFQVDQIEKVREPTAQMERMHVPEEHLGGHAFHTYKLIAPDNMMSFEFQHNVCGRSVYAEGAVDACIFLAKKIAEKSEKKLFNMVDVLKGGAMR